MIHVGCGCRGLKEDPHDDCQKHREQKGLFCDPDHTCNQCATTKPGQWKALLSAQRKQKRQRDQQGSKERPAQEGSSPHRSRSPRDHCSDRDNRRSQSARPGPSSSKRKKSTSPQRKRPKYIESSSEERSARKKVKAKRRTPEPQEKDTRRCTHAPKCTSRSRHEARCQVPEAQQKSNRSTLEKLEYEQRQHELEVLQERQRYLKRQEIELAQKLDVPGPSVSDDDLFDDAEPYVGTSRKSSKRNPVRAYLYSDDEDKRSPSRSRAKSPRPARRQSPRAQAKEAQASRGSLERSRRREVEEREESSRRRDRERSDNRDSRSRARRSPRHSRSGIDSPARRSAHSGGSRRSSRRELHYSQGGRGDGERVKASVSPKRGSPRRRHRRRSPASRSWSASSVASSRRSDSGKRSLRGRNNSDSDSDSSPQRESKSFKEVLKAISNYSEGKLGPVHTSKSKRHKLELKSDRPSGDDEGFLGLSTASGIINALDKWQAEFEELAHAKQKPIPWGELHRSAGLKPKDNAYKPCDSALPLKAASYPRKFYEWLPEAQPKKLQISSSDIRYLEEQARLAMRIINFRELVHQVQNEVDAGRAPEKLAGKLHTCSLQANKDLLQVLVCQLSAIVQFRRDAILAESPKLMRQQQELLRHANITNNACIFPESVLEDVGKTYHTELSNKAMQSHLASPVSRGRSAGKHAPGGRGSSKSR